MEKEILNIPLIPLRGMTIFPNMVMHFDIGREKSIASLEQAMLENQKILLATQKDATIEEPTVDDIYSVGTICEIKQMIKLPGNLIRVLVEGIERAKLISIDNNNQFYVSEVIKHTDENFSDDDNEIEALVRSLKTQFQIFDEVSGVIGQDVIASLDEIENPGTLADILASYMSIKQGVKQEILEAFDVKERIEKLIILIKDEIEIVKIEKKIGLKLKTNIDKLQKEYYLREQLKVIQEELGEDDENKREIKEYESKIKSAKLPKVVKEKAMYELSRLKANGSSSESGVIKTYLDWILDLPWNKSNKDNIDIKKARAILEEEHYGLDDVKDRIIEYLAVKKMSSSLKGPILCLVGPPGVGKTSIAKSVAKALNRSFVRISLGGVRDEAEIRGHRKTYVGAIPGRIVYSLKQAKSNNPLILFDEIDKMSSDTKGNPADALLEVLDGEQNHAFRDHYLELETDLSKVMFITTANSLDTIPRPLLDRMEIIEVSGYTYEEKFNIARKHLIPKILKENGTDSETINLSESSIRIIIENYTKESGVRSLERVISSVIRKAIRDIFEKDKKRVNITTQVVEKYLGPKYFTYDKIDEEDKIGVVTGMAWTAYGGDTLPVEITVMDGSGKLELTGQLGDVMKESAKAAYSYVRANSNNLNIKDAFYKKKDIHIHVPEGAVPKDGPSAGVTMATALVSALTKKQVRHNVAMTGEITLTGRVLPIGGLKEKSLAAYRAGIDTIIIPKANYKDSLKIPRTIKSKLNIILAEKIDDVLKSALVGEDKNEN
ncbi:ATP-dependent proteinase. Serine peptidase. MEROPS family S16 [Clostridium cavendishii DSM 21758]|uniref:Lon protease n=1 Tax=Clostridium cavendishii DSM 21758 TaxID=1121302 RepID=A0A1M6EK37_9CLOT|nr:endopeptidase La [Clostridium cavendishii]SHI85827.1 ATP-dependent proteinase. Serine peptidase. MEROPS family S16 [Clostridium cavendishii DSM 21758]